MKKHVLFIHGAGQDAYEADKKLVNSLQSGLGDEYNVRYPHMPGEDPQYETWKATIAQELAPLSGGIVLVGHSLGGSVLLKYLAEEQVATPVTDVFLLAAPFWNGDDEDWQYDGFALHEGFAAKLSMIPRMFFFHSRDDEIVPFAHLAMYAAKLPQATIRALDDRGHQFKNDLSEVAEDMMSRDGS